MTRSAGGPGRVARPGRPGEVRLIGGAWKRSKLRVPDIPGLRPTPDRVRETLFNWLGQRLDGWRCLDAFAGSGALGFEAASRGAAEVLLLEQDAGAVAGLQAARQRLGGTTLRVERADALAWMRRCADATWDLVFLDPPFDTGLLAPALSEAVRLVPEGGWVYVEGPVALADPPHGLECPHRGRAGAVHYALLRRRYTAAV
ncbi:MAG: 16S rRNA (guanine(966)-N(2))-methyltransferase RsmD [Rubrivivax sp.]|nr:16S rRNA (guanine(966)-N(2))-methyltransferase RsmD [Rubrivivax sp.]